MEEFRNTIHQKRHRIDKELNDYIDSVSELKLEEASIQDKINAKRIFLQETEQKLINDKTSIELAELTARQKFAEELERQSKREVELKDEELEIVTQLNIDKRDIELAEIEARINNLLSLIALFLISSGFPYMMDPVCAPWYF